MSERPSWEKRGGPSQRLIAWRRFVIETVVCVVLIGVMGVVALDARHDALAGVSVIAVASVIVGITRR
jgi:undecaprenyl pyrophosphate phosphatase UppP